MSDLLNRYLTDRHGLTHAIDEIKSHIPGTLADGMNRVDKIQAVADYKARFNRDQ